MCRSCFDKLSTNGGCNCSKLKTLYELNVRTIITLVLLLIFLRNSYGYER
ncbi:hypothetical protein CRENPOLYSF1_1260002 [Crenothrix polyspora]|uniref:Uncharacterized protein n=1 Tax=Crenothrix polyspora TaxID=360316 RepID=A0A1R4H100_9GAMM|nr:hypothetical protein CRENPOLYSF1_1260002 [Crenothrix polyspora]